ncbi:DUF354 domain-containing protein [Haloarchaeobius sp. DFWS5]|uniref:DUF354 domain-containing protein n=1 Tax=Haloarchaeobius sp. DFWS5 TaxID=3446114 RepID=UPI003EBF0CDC
MRYQFFTNTPAHVHLYKHAAERLRAAGNDVLVLAREYGCTVDLLDDTGLPYVVYGSCDTTKGSLFRELPGHYFRIARETRRFDPDLIFGIGAYAAHAGALARTPVVLVHDSEPTSLDHAISKPFARAILTPHAFRKELGAKHLRFRGFKESAYLHPEVFSASDGIRDLLGVAPDERYAILRFNAFGSHHDVNHSGFSPADRRDLVEQLSEHVTVFVSDEGGKMNLDQLDARPFDLHPSQLHDALAEADLLIADTQTMVTEAALLGTPAIRSNSFVGDDDMGNFVELEQQGLVENVGEFDEVLTRAEHLLEVGPDDDWRNRYEAYVNEMVNLTDVLVAAATRSDDIYSLPRLERA